MTTKNVLIADDDWQLVEALAMRVEMLGLETRTAYDAVTALNMAHERAPDLIILDVNMPAGNGLSVCEMLATDPTSSLIPVVILTGQKDRETVMRCHDMLAYYVPKMPDIWHHLEPLLRELLVIQPNQPSQNTATVVDANASTRSGIDATRVTDEVFSILGIDVSYLDRDSSDTELGMDKAFDPPPWVLHVEDDIDFSNSVKLRLEAYGVAVIRAFDGMEGYRSAFAYAPDAIILDVEMPNGRGDYVLRRLKKNAATKDIPVIVLTGRRSEDLEHMMLSLGADAYLKKPVVIEEFVEALSKHIDILPKPSFAVT